MASTIGFSTHSVLAEAATEAGRVVRQSRERPALVLLLATHSYPLDQLAGAASALHALFGPGVQIAAGTVNGLLYRKVRYDAMLAQQRAAAVVGLGWADVPGERVGAALAPDPRPEPRRVGRELAERARAALGGARLESGLLFSPGLPHDELPLDPGLVDGLRQSEPSIAVAGTGLSGGVDLQGLCDPGFALLGDRVERGGALFLAFEGRAEGDGPRRTALAVANGLRAVDAPPLGVINRAEGARIFTLDGAPAFGRVLEAVRRHKRGRESNPGDLEKNLGLAMVERRLSLAVEDPAGDFFWPRIPLRSKPDGSFLEAFEAEPGEVLRLVEADEASCLEATREAALRLREGRPAEAPFELVLAFSCSIRGFVLGARAAEEGRELGSVALCDDDGVLGVVANGEFGTHRGGRPRATGWAHSLFGLSGDRRTGDAG
ncbi:MAG TPA: FIST N-terminal domain-containing protein [Polyangiaceae bacterium]|nr:FIST N-terminal domain-containing protein [Polyangiaceae bacterium]